MQSPREFQLGPISAKEISDRFKNIAESIIRDHYPPELNRQIAFDGAMVLAHLLPHPGIEVNTAIRVDLEQMILRAQKYLHQEYA